MCQKYFWKKSVVPLLGKWNKLWSVKFPLKERRPSIQVTTVRVLCSDEELSSNGNQIRVESSFKNYCDWFIWLFDYMVRSQLVENAWSFKPITFKESVIFMINAGRVCFVIFLQWKCDHFHILPLKYITYSWIENKGNQYSEGELSMLWEAVSYSK